MQAQGYWLSYATLLCCLLPDNSWGENIEMLPCRSMATIDISFGRR